ncbi:hypothetical protein HPB49_013563 [Dermacentor silvarum]|uniref:Uncharacterized protein n=1 Tax=Dermacentor silvarum TaxID=543639 RepID=A0ACB8CL67_DERSI|nr:hypothetical protein HPB49_013563 [Dermacentor silvarum]
MFGCRAEKPPPGLAVRGRQITAFRDRSGLCFLARSRFRALTTVLTSRVSRLHCESESFKMDLILDVNTMLYPVDLGEWHVPFVVSFFEHGSGDPKFGSRLPVKRVS